MNPVRVLIVDDSAVVRTVLARGLAQEGLEVAGAAADPYAARDLILLKKPDVLTLDLEMPRMDGLTFLGRLMAHHPLPVVVLSSLTQARSEMALRALEAGAVDVMAKPDSGVTVGLTGGTLRQLAEKLKTAAQARPRRKQEKTVPFYKDSRKGNGVETDSDRVVAVGASTGGTQALAELLEALPAGFPGIVVVQHMPPFFTKAFAERLDKACALRVKEASTGDVVKDGTVLIAPGDCHMTLKRSGGRFTVECRQGPLVHHVRPSVDVLFHSAAQAVGPNAVGILLTGMGKDGAEGLYAMRQAGAATLAQDEGSCVVYGMPKEAVALGAVEESVPLSRMAAVLQSKIQGLKAPAATVKK